MTGNSYRYLGKILFELSKKLTKELIRNSGIHSELSSFRTTVLYSLLIKCIGIFLNVQDETLLNKTYDNIDYKIYELYKFGNLKIMEMVDRVNVGLAIMNLPFIKHRTVHTEYVETWSKEDFPTFFTKGIKTAGGRTFVKISQQLAKYLSKISNCITIQAMVFKNDPYWWSDQVETEVVSLSIGHKTTNKRYSPIKSFMYPIDVFLKKKSNQKVTVSGEVTQPDPQSDPDKKDFTIAVHKIYSKKGAKLSIRFINLGEKDSFRVIIMVNQRPDFDHLLTGGYVTQSSPWYHSTKQITQDEDIAFIGILPGKNVSIGKTVYYKFELQSAGCQAWYDVMWTSSGCSLGSGSTEEILHCQCYHLSSISGFLKVPINTVDPFTDYKLFLTIPENPYVFVFVTTILLIYIIMLIWSIKTDSKDLPKANLIVLEDNISTDLFGYLVIVFTGSRLCAGTSSNIGIILHGSKASSRSHMLRSSVRSTLKRNYDDWFLLFAPKHLGKISSIQLWTDHSGPAPNWFCDQVHIHDITIKSDYTFMLAKWFGITQIGTRVESFARPIQLETEGHFVEYFLTNTVFGFRESHLWVSILSRHPRSPISRSQRLSMAMVALIVTLLTSIMFYNTVMPEEEDAPIYSINFQEVKISIYSLAIAAVITSVVYFAFHKSYIYYEDYEVVSKSGPHRKTKKSSRMNVDGVQTLKVSKQTERTFKYYFKKTILSMRKEYFYPVQANSNPDTAYRFETVHKIRAIFAWTLCFGTILVTCFFIILYGLKLGKVKSLLWLTSICMSLGQDIFAVDPFKIVFISLLFGLVQTQFCDLYAYDPKIYTIRESSKIKRHLDQDHFIHQMRLRNTYKPISKERSDMIHKQQIKIEKWWALIDIIDICFAVIAMFLIISQTVLSEPNNSLFKKMLFRKIMTDENLSPQPLEMVPKNVSSFSHYLQSNVFPSIYSTKWYNKLPLTSEQEQFPDTGWTQDLTHRMMGVPRLRQIRVQMKPCQVPSILKNVSFYCNVLFTQSTEDNDDYDIQWRVISWDDVKTGKSPWKYFNPEDSSSINMFAESGTLFHGGGYVAELKRTRRNSQDSILHLRILVGWI